MGGLGFAGKFSLDVAWLARREKVWSEWKIWDAGEDGRAWYRWRGTDGPGFAGRYVDGWAWYRWLVWPEGLVSQVWVEVSEGRETDKPDRENLPGFFI